MALEGRDGPRGGQAYHEAVRARDSGLDLRELSEDTHQREKETPFWLLVQKAPQGELAGGEWKVAGRCAFPMVAPKDGKGLCFTFGR